MHLVRRAQEDPMRFDLHETECLVKDLGIYDHLRRLLRLCIVHFYRNIQKTQVPDSVRNQMRSLVCVEHSDWDGTLMQIETEGGKAGKGTNSITNWTYKLFTSFVAPKTRLVGR